jgi:hypothetical protein
MNFEFNANQQIDSYFFKQVLETVKFPNLSVKLKEGMKKVDSTYANMIKQYSGLNIMEISITDDNVLESVDRLLSNIDYVKVIRINLG